MKQSQAGSVDMPLMLGCALLMPLAMFAMLHGITRVHNRVYEELMVVEQGRPDASFESLKNREFWSPFGSGEELTLGPPRLDHGTPGWPRSRPAPALCALVARGARQGLSPPPEFAGCVGQEGGSHR